jgi:hypothetical protein
MLPTFLIEETTVRESGESPVFDASEHSNQNVLLTFAITHAVEHESIDVEIHGSVDGMIWWPKPLAHFTPKFYCGTYQTMLDPCDMRYIKATWRVRRWSRDDCRPFFSFYIYVQQAGARMAVAGAA